MGGHVVAISFHAAVVVRMACTTRLHTTLGANDSARDESTRLLGSITEGVGSRFAIGGARLSCSSSMGVRPGGLTLDRIDNNAITSPAIADGLRGRNRCSSQGSNACGTRMRLEALRMLGTQPESTNARRTHPSGLHQRQSMSPRLRPRPQYFEGFCCSAGRQ